MSGSLTLKSVSDTAELIDAHVCETPVVEWSGPALKHELPIGTRVFAKLEMFQKSGTFKARGALSNILRLTSEECDRGVTAMSAGNHAVAIAYAARACGVSAKVVMQKSANPARIKLARNLGAEILIAEDGPSGFKLAEAIAKSEGRTFVHPFDGHSTALGTATLGLEFNRQVPNLDLLFVAIGGGGLAGGVSAITKIVNPDCQIIGIEPSGADSMHQSFASGRAENIGIPNTIADSLAPPMTTPIPYHYCRTNIDELALVSDDEMRAAMRLIFEDLKLAVEPACAATTAAVRRMAKRFPGQRIGIVMCGSNIDFAEFSKQAFDHSGT